MIAPLFPQFHDFLKTETKEESLDFWLTTLEIAGATQLGDNGDRAVVHRLEVDLDIFRQTLVAVVVDALHTLLKRPVQSRKKRSQFSIMAQQRTKDEIGRFADPSSIPVQDR